MRWSMLYHPEPGAEPLPAASICRGFRQSRLWHFFANFSQPEEARSVSLEICILVASPGTCGVIRPGS